MIRCPLCNKKFTECGCDQNKVREHLVEELESARREIQQLNDRIDKMVWEQDMSAIDE